MSTKRLLQSLTPPLLWTIARSLKSSWSRSVDRYEYAPEGWDTPLPDDATPEKYWTAYLQRDLTEREAWIAHVRAGHSVMTEGAVDLKRITFGYALALMTRDHRAISILDYGGGLAEDYWIGRALVPDVALDYHCKEFPAVAKAGRAVSPDVKWHTDDACLQHQYDLVKFSTSLQYMADWKQMIRLAAAAARRHLFISDIPIVSAVPTSVATECSASGTNLHWLLNRVEILETLDQSGFTVVQELPAGEYPEVVNAPEQPTCVTLVCERRSTAI